MQNIQYKIEVEFSKELEDFEKIIGKEVIEELEDILVSHKVGGKIFKDLTNITKKLSSIEKVF